MGNNSQTCHDRSLTPVPPLPEGEGYGSSLREFYVKRRTAPACWPRRHKVRECRQMDTDDTCDSPVITCATCKACCCRQEVMLMGDDDIPPELTKQDSWGGWIMARLGDGWCAALDRKTMLCTIYARRPMICGDYRAGESDCLKERLLHNID